MSFQVGRGVSLFYQIPNTMFFLCFTDAVMAKFGVDQNHVKEAIIIKLNNEDKLKKRLTQKFSISVGSL
jgi:hypothetical protein